jgi:hypothetical protein
MKNLKTRGRLAASLALVAAVAVGSLVGGAATGRAATGFTVDLQPLIGTPGVNLEIPQVTFGGKIGYHLFIQNTGDSSTQHVSIVVTSDLATFLDADNPACAQGATTKQMICTPPGATLNPGDTFEVNFRFTAPSTETQVSTKAAITIAAQTVGGKKTKGTTLQESLPVLTDVKANGTKNDTFLRETESATTGALSNNNHRQNFGVTFPSTFLGDPFGVALSIHDNVGSICTDCLGVYTELKIPAASDAEQAGNPFYNDPVDGDPVFNPYSWSLNARYEASFKIDGLIHVDDANVAHVIPSCAVIGGAPTIVDTLCWDTFVTGLSAPGSLKELRATGRGLENGKIGAF